jgi:hypothetical protein
MPVEAFMRRLKQWTDSWQPEERVYEIILANFVVDEDGKISPRLSYEHHMRIVRSIWEFRTYDCYRQVRCPALMLPVRPKPPLSESELRFLSAKEKGIQTARESIQDLQVEWLVDCVHDVPLQQPGRLAEMIADFDTQS